MVSQLLVTQIGLRKRLYRQLEPERADTAGVSPLNIFIIVVVLLSFLALALETEQTLGPAWQSGIAVFNLIILSIFTFEYLARFWVAGEHPKFRGFKGRLHYMVTPYAISDLIAFLPELLWLLFAPDHHGADVLVILRVLRLARLIKIARIVPAVDVLGATIQRAGIQLVTTLAMALVLVYISAVALYFVEGVGGQQQASFASIPRSLWWAIATLTTVGYGDVYPVTPLGRIFASVIALIGIGVVALPAGVFASAFSDELREREIDSLKKKIQARGGGDKADGEQADAVNPEKDMLAADTGADGEPASGQNEQD